MELNKLTILQAHQGLKNKEFSSQELTKACVKAIKRKDKQINAFISVLADQSIEQARQADKKIASQGPDNFLHGIPLAIKDNILIDEVRCTAGSKILDNYMAVEDAAVIKKLKQKKAIFLGKTNMDEFAMGASTENSAYGPTKNPHNLDYVPGGSSGGSAAAVAADMCLGALGTDTGGSIRQPASFCGVKGLKLTYGRVSRYGLIAMASSLDQIGPITKSVDDLAVLLAVIEGRDSLDSTSTDLMFTTEVPVKDIDPRNIRIGIPKEYFACPPSLRSGVSGRVKGLDPQIKKIIEKVIKSLQNQGAEIVEVSLPHTEHALSCYYIIMPAEASANLARYDGIKYGFSAIDKDNPRQSLLDVYLNTRTKGFGDEVKRRIMLGTYALSAGYYESYYLKAQKVRTLIKNDFISAFEKKGNKQIDCLITPTSPTTAFCLGEKVDDPLTMYLSDIYTVSVNLAGVPGLSLPIGKIKGMPVGVQLIGNYFAEHKLLQIAKIIENLNAHT